MKYRSFFLPPRYKSPLLFHFHQENTIQLQCANCDFTPIFRQISPRYRRYSVKRSMWSNSRGLVCQSSRLNVDHVCFQTSFLCVSHRMERRKTDSSAHTYYSREREAGCVLMPTELPNQTATLKSILRLLFLQYIIFIWNTVNRRLYRKLNKRYKIRYFFYFIFNSKIFLWEILIKNAKLLFLLSSKAFFLNRKLNENTKLNIFLFQTAIFFIENVIKFCNNIM